MKMILISLFTATLLGFASQISGHAVNAAEYTSILFAAVLLAWTVQQYSRPKQSLSSVKPIRLPIRSKIERLPTQAHRLAA